MFMKFAYALMFTIFIVSSSLTVYWANKNKERERHIKSIAAAYDALQYAFQQTVSYSVAGPRLRRKYLKDLDGDSTELTTIFPTEEKKLIFRFSEDQCLDCIDSTLAILKDAANLIGTSNIILLTSYHDVSALGRYRKIKNVPFKIYNADSNPFELPTDDMKSPFLFVVDRGEIAELPLMIRSDNPPLTRYYISAIQAAFVRKYNKKYPITIEKTASIGFIQSVFDLGNVVYNGHAVAKFKFRNNGAKPLVITSVVTGCGCTAASYQRQPILRGDSSVVEISYDTQRTGTFDRTVYVYSNALQSPTLIRIHGYIGKK